MDIAYTLPSPRRHDAYIKRHWLRWRWWQVRCKRCKALDEGPYSREFAAVRVYAENHRKAPTCQ
jgi:uncharacterized membrane protein